MPMSFVVAVAENGVIGRDGRLPWHLPADLRHFRRLTLGKPVVMGRRTAESIGRPLPDRINIVVSRGGGPKGEGWVVVDGPEAALEAARRLAGRDAEVMVIGGEAIFAHFLPRADRIYLTELHRPYEGDTQFPPIDRAAWRETARVRHAGQGEEPDYSFVTLERVGKPAG